MSRLIGWNAFGVILSIIIGFIPSIIAFVKQNIYKGHRMCRKDRNYSEVPY